VSRAHTQIHQRTGAARSARKAMADFAALTDTPKRRALFARQLRQMFEASGPVDPEFLSNLPELVEQISGDPQLLRAVVESIKAQEVALRRDLRAGAAGFGRAAARTADAVAAKRQQALRSDLAVARRSGEEASVVALEVESRRLGIARSRLAHVGRVGSRSRGHVRRSQRAAPARRSRRSRQTPSSPGPPRGETEPPPRCGGLEVGRDHTHRVPADRCLGGRL
jgi:hypothetical protein